MSLLYFVYFLDIFLWVLEATQFSVQLLTSFSAAMAGEKKKGFLFNISWFVKSKSKIDVAKINLRKQNQFLYLYIRIRA